MCVWLKLLGPMPRSSVRWSPRHSGHSSGLHWHPAVARRVWGHTQPVCVNGGGRVSGAVIKYK